MRKIVFFVLLCISTTLFAQRSFPDSWIGYYEGELEIYAVDSIAMKLKMKLAIQPIKNDSIYQWKLTYVFKGQEDFRDYELNVVNTKKGHYQIDEKNSIVIDAFYRNNIFTSFFKVGESNIIASYKKEKETIVFEIIATNSIPVSTTGGGLYKEEEIPKVESFIISGRQQAILYKIKK